MQHIHTLLAGVEIQAFDLVEVKEKMAVDVHVNQVAQMSVSPLALAVL